MKADLHLHSIYSDGDLNPKKLIEIAKQQNIQVVALTDHDTTDGQILMAKYAKKAGIECFTGIEFSAFDNVEIHILGYNVDIFDETFLKNLNKIKMQRKLRVIEIINKLNKSGIDITEQEVYLNSSDITTVGRLHIAKTLVKKNAVKSVECAFDNLLGYGKDAYVPSFRLKTEEVISIIKAAKGKAVLAHPFLINIKQQALLPLINRLVQCGLDGIEATYFAHNNFENMFLSALAKKLNLIATCGSDFHGELRQAKITGFELDTEDYLQLKS